MHPLPTWALPCDLLTAVSVPGKTRGLPEFFADDIVNRSDPGGEEADLDVARGRLHLEKVWACLCV